MVHQYERDLFLPVKNLFEKLGYTVKGEIKNCDVVASNEKELIVIELKLHLNLEVILQAMQRQKITPLVYIAIPALKKEQPTVRHQKIYELLQKIEIGLIYVTPKNIAKVIFEPSSNRNAFTRDLDELSNVIREFTNRESINNEGGTTQIEIMTAYKEEAIKIARLLRVYTRLTLTQLRSYGTSAGTFSILNNNYYYWFERQPHGYYRLTKAGQKYLSELDIRRETTVYD